MEAGDVYRHYRGGEYRIIATFTWENTGESCIIYESLKDGTKWGRTVKQFTEQVSDPITLNQVPRFSPINQR
jgi:hypothetical protein